MGYPKDLRREFPTAFDRAYEQFREKRLVHEIMTPDVTTIEPEKFMMEAAQVMGSRHIGSIVVVVGGKPWGIVTERDLLSKVIASGKDPAQVRVSACMSAPLLRLEPTATIREAAKIMITRKGRLVVFEDNNLKGIVTASDLIKSMPHVSETLPQVREYMTTPVSTVDEGVTVAEVSRIMGKQRIGSVIVTRGGEPKGIFTERDLVTTLLAKGRGLDIPVGGAASEPLIYVPPHISVNEAAWVMSEKHIRRLPVFDELALVGIITARDLVEAYAK